MSLQELFPSRSGYVNGYNRVFLVSNTSGQTPINYDPVADESGLPKYGEQHPNNKNIVALSFNRENAGQDTNGKDCYIVAVDYGPMPEFAFNPNAPYGLWGIKFSAGLTQEEISTAKTIDAGGNISDESEIIGPRNYRLKRKDETQPTDYFIKAVINGQTAIQELYVGEGRSIKSRQRTVSHGQLRMSRLFLWPNTPPIGDIFPWLNQMNKEDIQIGGNTFPKRTLKFADYSWETKPSNSQEYGGVSGSTYTYDVLFNLVFEYEAEGHVIIVVDTISIEGQEYPVFKKQVDPPGPDLPGAPGLVTTTFAPYPTEVDLAQFLNAF